MPGPSKQPRSLALIKGTLQPSRDTFQQSSLPVFTKLPRPPIEVRSNTHAMREWRRVGPFLVRHKVLHEGNLSAFSMMCALYGSNVGLFLSGVTPTAAHIATHRALCGSLGLLNMNFGKPDRTNPFEVHTPRSRVPT